MGLALICLRKQTAHKHHSFGKLGEIGFQEWQNAHMHSLISPVHIRHVSFNSNLVVHQF